MSQKEPCPVLIQERVRRNKLHLRFKCSVVESWKLHYEAAYRSSLGEPSGCQWTISRVTGQLLLPRIHTL
jgi:hypothetical protein